MHNTFSKKRTIESVSSWIGNMKLFRILIVFLDMEIFVIGQDTKMISSGGLEMFPILRSSQYFPILRSSKTYISFWTEL